MLFHSRIAFLIKDIQHDDPDGLEIINITSLVPKATANDQARTDEPPSLENFRKENTDETSSRQRFMVSREDGLEELKKDILGCYKNPCIKLRAKPRVTFEGESGVGSGPVREFLLCSMKIVEDGIEKEGKPLLFFEGEEDYKVPIHNHTLRCMGAFKSIRRIVGHSILHEGPVVYGLSKAVVQYWTLTSHGSVDDISLESLALSIKDIPDIDLRGYISEVNTY